MRPALTITGGLDRTPWFVFDFETQSKADLKKVGGRRYAEDPSTRLLSVAFCVCTPDNPRPDVALSFSAAWPLDLREGEFIACAHNDTGFDRHIWERLGWPRAKRRADTANMARRSGHPDASLDYLMKRYLGREKDGEGNKLVKKLSRVSRAKATFGQLPYVHRDVLERIGAYNVSDTEGLRDLLPFLLEFDDLGEAENALLARDVEIMDRGVCFDSDLAEALIEADAAYAARVREQFQRPVADACVHVHSDGRVCGLTWEDHGSSFGEGTALAFEPHDFVECTEGRGVDASELRSRDQFLDLLRECGVDVKNAQKKTLEKLLGSEATPEHAKELIRARQAGASIAASKLRAGLARVSRDGRLRDLTMYYGAHTGRWAGRGMQVQNLTKGKELPEIAAIRKADALARGVPPAKGKVPWAVQDYLTEKRIREIKANPVGASLNLDNTHFATLTRAVLCAAAGNLLVVADFAGVEARWLAWAAKDLPALAVFEDPKGDPYRELASKLFRCTPEAVTDKQRQLGKIAILALGYGMGAKKFTKTLLDEGIDLAELKREFDLTPKKIVNVWRHEHAATVQHWADLERAAYEAVEGWSSKVGPYEWARVGEDVWCMLPSGRPLVYQNMSVVMWVRRGNWLSAQAPDGTWVSFELEPDDPRQGGPGLVYRSRKGWQSVYGGLFAENVTQAGCRDLLAHAILLISRDGIPIVMHVHDENVCEVPERFARDTLHRLEDYMSHKHAPEWARGMPLKAEGFITRRYRK
jgi:DNA polymerase